MDPLKKGKNLRSKVLDGYKLDRACPAELLPQLAKAREACTAMGFVWKDEVGYEADDLIATMARTAIKNQAWLHVNIVSHDKDLLQLVSPRVTFRNLDLRQAPVDSKKVIEDWGVNPEQIGDLLALCGDAADRVPGIPGIGRIRGAALLQKYSTLTGVLKAAASPGKLVAGVGPVLKQSICDYGERALNMRNKVLDLLDVPSLRQIDLKEFEVPATDEAWLLRVEAYCDSENLDTVKRHFQQTFVRPQLEAPQGADLTS